jgi:hypothetical protein
MAKQRLVFMMILGGAVAALVGCELAVDFDRSKIPADSTDAGAVDAFVPGDSGSTTDGATTTDGSTTDSGSESKDSGSATDSGTDSSFDASFDSSFDAGD